MLQLKVKQLIAVLILAISVFATLPQAAQCDTTYYEKYYSARKFNPLKRTTAVEYNFTVTYHGLALHDFERIALTGNLKELGYWQPQRAILLNRTEEHNVWFGTVHLPVNANCSYRYFIAGVDDLTKSVQIKHWESDVNARHFNTTSTSGTRIDDFGFITSGKRYVERGWLNSGRIVHFKVFRNPLKFIEEDFSDTKLRIKLQPVEPQHLTPILPSTRAHVEYVRMTYGDSFLREQPEFGVPYRPNDILMFHATLSELENVAYLLKVYATRGNNNLVSLIGYQHIYPHLLQGTEGNFTVNIISPVWLNSIGTLELSYLVVQPLHNDTLIDFHTSFANYWRANWTGLEMGHRGLGKSLKETTNAAPLIENTVASMQASAERGADFIEFDVQLTKDLIPIIYHDFSIFVCIKSKTPTSKDDLTEVLIKDVTYEQLKNLKTYQIVNGKIIEYPAHNSVLLEDNRLFPLFEDFLTKVNKSVGFDIEIKWPQLKANGLYESIQTIDKNLYVDSILDVMLRHGCGRMSIFTSFDADICSLLRFKQNMYPVMFLSSSVVGANADPRSDTIYDTINNAQAFDLAGIVPNAVFIKNNSNWINIAHKQNKKVILWGGDLKDRETINWFKQQGPEGVIYDRMDLHMPNKTNAFELEDDLPEFFNLQCLQTKPDYNTTLPEKISHANFL